MGELAHFTFCPACQKYTDSGACWRHPGLAPEYHERKNPRWAVLDCETVCLASDIGGWKALREQNLWRDLGLACVGFWDSETGETDIYDTHDLDEFFSRLSQVDLLVTYNGLDFDLPLLEAVSGRPISTEHFDILQAVWKSVPARDGGNKLNHIASATLGYGKTGNGLDAPRLLSEGQIARLHRYCMDDVRLTRDLMLHIRANGWVINGNEVKVPVEAPSWLR